MILDSLRKLPERFNAFSSENHSFLGFNPIPQKQAIKEFIRIGRWSILYLQTDIEYELGYGFRIMPQMSSPNWPIYKVTEINTSILYAPSLVSYVLFPHYEVLKTYSNAHVKYQEKWDKYESAILSYLDFWGIKSGIADLHDYAFHNQFWPEKSIGELPDKDYVNFMSRYADSDLVDYVFTFLRKMQEDPKYIPPIPQDDLGIWHNRITNVIGERATINSTSNIPTVRLYPQMIECFKQPHGYDAEDMNVYIKPNESIQSVYRIGYLVGSPLGRPATVEQKGILEEPEYKVLLAIRESGKSNYQGVEHIEAAAILDDKMNEPLRAWNCLLSAGYWAGLNKPELQETIMKAAIYLCRKHGWDEAADAVQYNLDIYTS